MDDLRELYRQEYVNKFDTTSSTQIKRIENIINNLYIQSNTNVADYGCGNGLLYEVIKSKVSSYSGIDFSQEFIDIFKKRIGSQNENNIKLYAEDIVEFAKYHNNEFDYAFTLDFSEHIYDNQFLEIYKSIFDTIKTGGKLFLHTPNGEYFIEILKDKGIMKQFPEHVAVRNYKQYVELLSKIGVANIEVRYLPHYTWIKYLHILSFMPLIGKYFKARLLITVTK